jgi:hypothetical protein
MKGHELFDRSRLIRISTYIAFPATWYLEKILLIKNCWQCDDAVKIIVCI